MKTHCPCGQPIEYPLEMAGSKVNCPSCNTTINLGASTSAGFFSRPIGRGGKWLVGVVALCVLFFVTDWKSSLSERKPSKQMEDHRIDVQLSRNVVTIQNRSSLDWHNVDVWLNDRSSGFHLRTSISAAGTANLVLRDFIAKDGARFNPDAFVPTKVIVQCDDYQAFDFANLQ